MRGGLEFDEEMEKVEVTRVMFVLAMTAFSTSPSKWMYADHGG